MTSRSAGIPFHQMCAYFFEKTIDFFRIEISISMEWKYLFIWNGNTGSSGSRNPCRGSASDIQIGWSTFLSDVTHRTFYFSQNMPLLWKYTPVFKTSNKNSLHYVNANQVIICIPYRGKKRYYVLYMSDIYGRDTENISLASTPPRSTKKLI